MILVKKCKNCLTDFSVEHYKIGTFCSRSCRLQVFSGIRLGKSHKSESILKISRFHKGKPLHPKVLERQRKGIKHSLESRLKMSESRKGNKNHMWRGGVTKENKLARHCLEYKLWREAVFKRDNFTCQNCGDNKGGNLNADHIKPFAFFPELRFSIDNGRTLCVPCHKKTSTFGWNYFNKQYLWQS